MHSCGNHAPSFRGASGASEPGIQTQKRLLPWIPGSRFARPGMTPGEFFSNLLEGVPPDLTLPNKTKQFLTIPDMRLAPA